MTTLTSLDDLKYVVSLSLIHGSKTFPMHRPIRKSLEKKVLDLKKVVTIFLRIHVIADKLRWRATYPALSLFFSLTDQIALIRNLTITETACFNLQLHGPIDF